MGQLRIWLDGTRCGHVQHRKQRLLRRDKETIIISNGVNLLSSYQKGLGLLHFNLHIQL